MTGQLKAKVLLVDDDTINVQLMGNALADECQLLLAQTGQTAIDMVHSEEPDLILLDIGLPDISGHEVCKALKANEATKGIPIVFITANDSEEDQVKGLEMGAVDYITKPFRMPLLKARIRLQLELKRKTDLLEHMASLDGLTHIPNRRQFDLIYDNEWRRAERKRYTLSLLFIDIDHFKALNDNLGHLQGDICLQHVARELEKKSKRAGDFVARFGGEEFTVVVPESGHKNAVGFAEHLRESIEGLAIAHPHSSVSQVLTVSLGVASCYPHKIKDKLKLLQAADEQLYAAKEAGRNRVSAIQLDI